MDEVEKVALKPCPFCGSGPARSPGRYTQASFSGVEVIRDWREPPTYSVQCGTCGASGSPERTEVEAIAAWNTRALDEARGDPVAKVVAWLRKENGLCDCHARSEMECGCGAWDDYKTKPLLEIADAIERGEHLK